MHWMLQKLQALLFCFLPDPTFDEYLKAARSKQLVLFPQRDQSINGPQHSSQVYLYHSDFFVAYNLMVDLEVGRAIEILHLALPPSQKQLNLVFSEGKLINVFMHKEEVSLASLTRGQRYNATMLLPYLKGFLQ